MSLSTYIHETKGELKHVNWPSRPQTIAYTAIVIAISVILAAMLGLFDGAFSVALEKLISHVSGV